MSWGFEFVRLSSQCSIDEPLCPVSLCDDVCFLWSHNPGLDLRVSKHSNSSRLVTPQRSAIPSRNFAWVPSHPWAVEKMPRAVFSFMSPNSVSHWHINQAVEEPGSCHLWTHVHCSSFLPITLIKILRSKPLTGGKVFILVHSSVMVHHGRWGGYNNRNYLDHIRSQQAG